MSAIEAKISLPRLGLLDEGTTKRLIAMSQAGDTSARDKLVQHNMRLVYSVVSHLVRPGCEFEDLFQVGCLGLMKAIDRFDLTYDVRFSTYAVPVIAGEVRRLIREDGMIKVSRSVRQLGRRLMAAREKLVADLSRSLRSLSLPVQWASRRRKPSTRWRPHYQSLHWMRAPGGMARALFRFRTLWLRRVAGKTTSSTASL